NLACASLVLVWGAGLALAFTPEGLVLTWRHDPTSSIVIDWHQDGGGAPAQFAYRKAGEVDRSWETVAPEPGRPFPFVPRRIYRVELKDLSADTSYEFR